MRSGQLLLAVVVMFLVWASVFDVQETVRLSGKVVPSGRTQVVQSADGGVLKTLYVSEGMRVKAGDILARLEAERAEANVAEIETKLEYLEATRVRALAEAEGREPDFKGMPIGAVQAQQALFDQRQSGLAEQTASLRASLDMASDEAERLATLFSSGDVSEMQRDAARREVLDLERDLNQLIYDARNAALREVTELDEEIATSKHNLALRQDRLHHTEVRAPVEGIVTHVAMNTIGAVLAAGDEVVRISPTTGGTYMSVEIPPAEIARLSVGMPVAVKLDSFDYRIWGGLDGELTYVSADSFTRETGDTAVSYYAARIAPAKVQSNPRLSPSALQPGFTGTADILIGSRSVLNYLLKPVRHAFAGALNES